MHSPPLSVHAKTEISTIFFLPGKYFLFTSEASSRISSIRVPAVMTNWLRNSGNALHFFFWRVLLFFFSLLKDEITTILLLTVHFNRQEFIFVTFRSL